MVFGEGSIVRYVWESVFEDGTWERFDFGESDWSPSEWMPGNAGCFHARADGEVAQGLSFGLRFGEVDWILFMAHIIIGGKTVIP